MPRLSRSARRELMRAAVRAAKLWQGSQIPDTPEYDDHSKLLNLMQRAVNETLYNLDRPVIIEAEVVDLIERFYPEPKLRRRSDASV